jgi:hypothetical protein
MINIPNGKYFLDGIDLATFAMIVEDGSADFLRFAPRKQSIQHDWGDANGIDVDLSRVFFKERTGTLNCAIITDTEEDFWNKHDAFITQFTQPGLHRLQITSHGQRSYFVCYQDCTTYKQVEPLTGSVLDGLIAHRFSIQIMEPQPQINNKNIFLVDHNGKFIIA